jgi:hypothetical protein
MQISAANLLASQSQAPSRTPSTAAAFEPIAFKSTPQAAVRQDVAKQAVPAAMTGTNATTGTAAASGYVRPGTNVDIKI